MNYYESGIGIEELSKHFNFKLISYTKPSKITYISSDSRKCDESIFFCLYDEFLTNSDKYLLNAINLKCSTFLISETIFNQLNSEIRDRLFKENIMLSDKNPSVIHGKIASFLLDNPSEKLEIIAVTGTNGKTTITSVLFNLFLRMNLKSGLIGTINIKYGDKIIDSSYTTPDPSSLQLILYEMLKEGIEYVFMEASSHGLKLGRINGCSIRAGIFSNLTPDHLDFHLTMEDYFLSKFKLFEILNESPKKNKLSIVSVDSPGGKEMIDKIKTLNPNFLSLGFGKDELYYGFDLKLSLQGSEFKIRSLDQIFNIKSNLLGNYNYLNISLVYILAINLYPTRKEEILRLIAGLSPVEGRFELVYSKDRTRLGIVDYAHTPDALENILKSMKEIPNSGIITIFGCGGDRDRKKRPIMGEIACSFSKYVIITSDNPRTEEPFSILNEISKDLPEKFNNFELIVDRRSAIQRGVELLSENGFLLIAGKGHENYQIIGTKKLPFSDTEELKKAFQI